MVLWPRSHDAINRSQAFTMEERTLPRQNFQDENDPTNDSSKRFTSRPAPTEPDAGLALSLQINLYGLDLSEDANV